MRGAPLVMALVLAIPLAGCLEALAPPASAPPAAPSGPTPSGGGSAGGSTRSLVLETDAHGAEGERCTGLGSWRQPGLFAALPEAQGVDGARVYHDAPEPGLPFAHAEAAAWHGAALNHFGREERRSGGSWGASLFVWRNEGRLEVAGLIAPEWTEADVRAAFGTFVDAATRADDATRAAWADAFVASKQPGMVSYRPGEGERVEQYSYDVAIENHSLLSLADAWDARGGIATANATSVSSGSRSLAWVDGEGAKWEARLTLPVRTLVVDTPEGPLTVDVDGADRASAYTGPIVEAEDPEAWVARAFARLGLPEPPLEGGFERDGGVC